MTKPEAMAAALRGLGADDLVAKFRISHAEAKRIVWAAYGRTGGASHRRKPSSFVGDRTYAQRAGGEERAGVPVLTE